MLDINEILSFLQEPLGNFPDRSAKWLLTNTDNLRGLLEIIGGDLVNALDFSKVQLVNTTFISDTLREQESDLVFLLPFRDADTTEVMIYVLIEHQSGVDRAMGFGCYFICARFGINSGNGGYPIMSRSASGDFVRSFRLCFTPVSRDGKDHRFPLRR